MVAEDIVEVGAMGIDMEGMAAATAEMGVMDTCMKAAMDRVAKAQEQGWRSLTCLHLASRVEVQGRMIKASTTPSPTEEEVEEYLWTDRGLVIIMIAVEMVMGEGVVVTAMGLKACLGWFLLLSTSFMPLPL